MLQKKKILPYQLIKNHKYFIEYTGLNNSIIYTGIYKNSYEGINSSNFCIMGRLYIFYNDYCMSYYTVEFQKENIQNAMELRALNMILQRITGDETFNFI
uniref:Uncharacterized protein n=1 Tax=viral metagenome TaxID=1070528 RepID=A0A6C0ETX4_9ZZZZ